MIDFTKMKAAVFDMDGTILDSMPMWHNMTEIILREYGFEPEKDVWDKVKRLTSTETARYFIDYYGVKMTVDEICKIIEDKISYYYENELQLKEGARELLRFLNERKIPCVLATATERRCVLSCFKRLDIEKYFSRILTCMELGTSKSSPFIFEEAARLAGAKVSETVIFEDALHAIRTAAGAGFPLAVIYDKSTEEITEPPLSDRQRIEKIVENCGSVFENPAAALKLCQKSAS